MKNFSILDFIIIVIALLVGSFAYACNVYISEKTILAIITVPFTLTAFLLSISALIVNSWEHDIVQKLIESKHYNDLLSMLKITSYSFIFTGSIAMVYGIFFDIFTNKGLVIFSVIILVLFFISVGYLIKNIRRIFLILEYLGKS